MHSKSEWKWCGAIVEHDIEGHCTFYLSTLVGNYRIITRGGYVGHTYLTLIFDENDNQVDIKSYEFSEDANEGHIVMCNKWWKTYKKKMKNESRK